jgi:hypothetical protein
VQSAHLGLLGLDQAAELPNDRRAAKLRLVRHRRDERVDARLRLALHVGWCACTSVTGVASRHLIARGIWPRIGIPD